MTTGVASDDLKLQCIRLCHVFRERKLTFTFAICFARPSVCRLSVTFVHPTQATDNFGNISTFGALAIPDL